MVDIERIPTESVRRQIAIHLGYRLEKKKKKDKTIYTILSPQNHIIIQRESDNSDADFLAWFNLPPWRVPNWPEDDSAALALCLDICKKKRWQIEINPHHDNVYAAAFTRLIDNGKSELVMIRGVSLGVSFCDTTAEALARVALIALDEMKIACDKL